MFPVQTGRSILWNITFLQFLIRIFISKSSAYQEKEHNQGVPNTRKRRCPEVRLTRQLKLERKILMMRTHLGDRQIAMTAILQALSPKDDDHRSPQGSCLAFPILRRNSKVLPTSSSPSLSPLLAVESLSDSTLDLLSWLPSKAKPALRKASWSLWPSVMAKGIVALAYEWPRSRSSTTVRRRCAFGAVVPGA